jgi:hypothetical protein
VIPREHWACPRKQTPPLPGHSLGLLDPVPGLFTDWQVLGPITFPGVLASCPSGLGGSLTSQSSRP